MSSKLSLVTENNHIVLVKVGMRNVDAEMEHASKKIKSSNKQIFGNLVDDDIYVLDKLLCVLTDWIVPERIYFRLRPQQNIIEIIAIRVSTIAGVKVYPFKEINRT
jgi:hypothetical protein